MYLCMYLCIYVSMYQSIFMCLRADRYGAKQQSPGREQRQPREPKTAPETPKTAPQHWRGQLPCIGILYQTRLSWYAQRQTIFAKPYIFKLPIRRHRAAVTRTWDLLHEWFPRTYKTKLTLSSLRCWDPARSYSTPLLKPNNFTQGSYSTPLLEPFEARSFNKL